MLGGSFSLADGCSGREPDLLTGFTGKNMKLFLVPEPVRERSVGKSVNQSSRQLFLPRLTVSIYKSWQPVSLSQRQM